MSNKEIEIKLLEICNILEGAEDQGGQRVQEFNSTVYWLTKVNSDGLGETVQSFYKEVLESTK